MFPKIPSWEAMHPLVVHFPIALLMVAPLLVALGLVLKRHAYGLTLGGWILMALGTEGAWVSVSTGEAAVAFALRGSAQILEAIERHRVAAANVRTVFTVMTVLFAALTWGPARVSRPLPPRVHLGLTIVLLAAYAGALLLLMKAAHFGGLLVHEYGIRAEL